MTHLGERRKGVHEPIVDEETFWKAQQPRRRVVRRKHPPALVQGIATCATCGYAIYPSRVRRSAKQHDILHHYYREPSKDFHRDCPDGGKLWRMDEVDPLIDEVMRSLMVGDAWLDFVQREAQKVPDDAAQQRRDLKARFDRVPAEYIAGRLETDAWARMADEFSREMAMLPESPSVLLRQLERITCVAPLWDSASAATRNETCKLVFESVGLDMGNKTLTLKPWPEFEPLISTRAVYVTSTSPGPG